MNSRGRSLWIGAAPVLAVQLALAAVALPAIAAQKATLTAGKAHLTEVANGGGGVSTGSGGSSGSTAPKARHWRNIIQQNQTVNDISAVTSAMGNSSEIEAKGGAKVGVTQTNGAIEVRSHFRFRPVEIQPMPTWNAPKSDGGWHGDAAAPSAAQPLTLCSACAASMNGGVGS